MPAVNTVHALDGDFADIVDVAPAGKTREVSGLMLQVPRGDAAVVSTFHNAPLVQVRRHDSGGDEYMVADVQVHQDENVNLIPDGMVIALSTTTKLQARTDAATAGMVLWASYEDK